MEALVVMAIVAGIAWYGWSTAYASGKRAGSRKGYGVGYDRGRRSKNRNGCLVVLVAAGVLAAAGAALAYFV